MIILSQVRNEGKCSCHVGKARYVPSKTGSGVMELELGLTEHSRSFYKNRSPCAQKCIQPFAGDEKAGPALKILQFGQEVPWEDALWGCGKLWVCISAWGKGEQSITEESRWCELKGMQTALTVHEIRERRFSKHILQLDLAAGSFAELIDIKTWRFMCSFWRWFWLDQRHL